MYSEVTGERNGWEERGVLCIPGRTPPKKTRLGIQSEPEERRRQSNKKHRITRETMRFSRIRRCSPPWRLPVGADATTDKLTRSYEAQRSFFFRSGLALAMLLTHWFWCCAVSFYRFSFNPSDCSWVVRLSLRSGDYGDDDNDCNDQNADSSFHCGEDASIWTTRNWRSAVLSCFRFGLLKLKLSQLRIRIPIGSTYA